MRRKRSEGLSPIVARTVAELTDFGRRFEFPIRYWLVDQWKGYTTVDKHLKATTHMID